ncbi:hypothetical protein DOTSEDRAFT_70828 [Dothistroma septosporum NZE10]|uniref:Uncharacterized protein n=1 Tax=Dothistroma septosporum (strain NZE10 / CBS 128990) TaxID=675120 RepID=N1PNB1_DOTSN|nr:hypothetical protein DOTSEDRAFT_70828 [Dothistroma septosporum NZE10]
MAAATEYAQTGFSPSSSFSAARSPDTASPIYPERAIRPLPRNRLKSKLSPEQASTIQFPPEPAPISPTLSFNLPEASAPSQHRRLTNGHSYHEHDPDDEDYDSCQHRQGHRVVHHHCTCHEDADSGEDEVEFDHPDYRYPPVPVTNGSVAKPVDSLQRRLVEASRASGKSPPSGSTASSADGYESFENTSNKKKRKIPLSGASSMHQSSLSAEMANMGISNTHTDGALDDISVHGQTAAELEQHGGQAGHASIGASGTGISGAGRGRFGRQDARHRKPLGHAVNTSNLHNSRHSNGAARNGDPADSGVENTGGIISQAIKTAAEQGPLTPAVKGRENTQFTFTCESDSATKMVDQHAAHAAPYGTPTPQRHAAAAERNSHGTQTTPNHRGGHPPNNTARPPPPPANHAPPAGHHQQQQQQQQPAAPPKPRPRRNPTREYALQAAQRKKSQQYQNYHHRPKSEDMYICMFCEYEDIYGVPPYALIRQYEIKDRKEKKKAAEKRRLLEKAKMKGRKNKKGAKGKNNAANNTANPAPPAHSQNYDPNLPPPDGEEFYDDDEEEYEGDDYDPIGEDEQYDDEGYYPPPPAPASTPSIPRTERAPG